MKKTIKRLLFVMMMTPVIALAQTDSYDTNRGFVHPGGFHSQEDFDRIKQQLAEGNPKVTEAYNVLKTAGYAQPTAGTSPTEYVVRGGGNGENYMNAARGACTAYQNGLRWKIEGNKACAANAVKILMAWANTTKGIGGDTNYALASGIYGYEFAQAAELVRDYEGWSKEEFEQFKQWMLDVWYVPAIGFLRGRNGSWENVGKWWQAPGHYWSNWGLANILCVAGIGVLCDDVFIYNQAMSFFKYDQVGTFKDPRTDDPIMADGLVDFLGNLVVTTTETELETGAYGKMGQMNESGRDGGHCALALGLALDVAKIGWNQGDDLFAYMDHRLAAGVEFVAGQTQSLENLPWTNYHYYSSGFAWTDGRSWLMTEPALPAHLRNYWGTAIGIYEGVKGVKMPLAEKAYNQMGIDGGGQGSTSGGYDHLGYSVLMNTRVPQIADPKDVPTELSPKIEYSGNINANIMPSLEVERALGNLDGKVIKHNELGGLVNKYTKNTNTAVPKGETLKLMPQLPEGEADTGNWTWNTGETTKDITVKADKSFIYRVTYVNANGVKSYQSFPIAVAGDCMTTKVTPIITYRDEVMEDKTEVDVLYGKTVKLELKPVCDWGSYKWSTGPTTQSITTAAIKASTDITGTFTNHGGREETRIFHINVVNVEPYIIQDDNTLHQTEIVVDKGASVKLGVITPSTVLATKVQWSSGTTGKTLELTDIQTSGTYTVSFAFSGENVIVDFKVLVKSDEPSIIEPGNYVIRHRASGKLLTAHENGETATLDDGNAEEPSESQIWLIENNGKAHRLTNPANGLLLSTAGKMSALTAYLLYAEKPIGEDVLVFRSGTTSKPNYLVADASETALEKASEFMGYPFEIIPVKDITGIMSLTEGEAYPIDFFSIDGTRRNGPQKGLNIVRMSNGTTKTLLIK